MKKILLTAFSFFVLTTLLIFSLNTAQAAQSNNSNKERLITSTNSHPAQELIQQMTKGNISQYKRNINIVKSIPDLKLKIEKAEIGYGGAYFDSGNIIVQLTSDGPQIKNEILHMSNYPNNIKFTKVKYSLNQLKNMKKKLAEFVKDNNIKNLGWGIDVKKNKLWIFGTNKQATASIEKLFNSPMVRFSTMIIKNQTSINPGDGIEDNPTGHCTVAFDAIDSDGHDVAVTAGHCQQSPNEIWYKYSGGSTIGLFTNVSTSTNSDSGYITLNSSTLIGTTDPQTNVPVGSFDWSADETVGWSYYLSSPFNNLLQITDDYVNVSIDGLNHMRVAEFDGAQSVDGSSGSPIYYFYWDSSKQRWQYMIEGIHKGIGTDPNTGTVYEVYSSAAYAANDLNLSAVYIAN